MLVLLRSLLYFLLLPSIGFATSLQDFLQSIDPAQKQDLDTAFRNVMINTELGYVLHGNKPVCHLAVPLKEMGLPSIFSHNERICAYSKSFYDILKELQLKTTGNYQIKISTKPEFGWLGFWIINQPEFLKIVNENITLFQYVLGPDVTAEGLLSRFLNEESFGSILKNDQTLIGIILGYGTQNALHYHRWEYLGSLSRELKSPLMQEKHPPSFNHSSIEEEAESLHKRFLNTRGIEFPPIPTFAYLENPESHKILSKFRQAQKKIRMELDSASFLENTLSMLFQEFPDPKALPKRPPKKALDEQSVIETICCACADFCKDNEANTAEWKEAFIEGLLSEKITHSPKDLGTTFWKLNATKTAYEAKRNLQKTDEVFRELAENFSGTVLKTGKLYYKTLQEGKDSIAASEQTSLSVSYYLEDFAGKSLSGCHENVPLANFIPGVALCAEGMKMGEIREMWIHPEYVYGNHFSKSNMGFCIRLEALQIEPCEKGGEINREDPNPCQVSALSEDELLEQCASLTKELAHIQGSFAGHELKYGIDLKKLVAVLQEEKEFPPLSSEQRELLHQFHLSVFKKQTESEQQEALKKFATLSPSATCISENRLYAECIEPGSGSVVEKDDTIQLRCQIKNQFGLTLINFSGPLDLKNAILGYQKGFEKQRVGTKLRLFIHPDWGFQNFSAPYGNSFLITEAEIIGLPVP